MNNNMFNLNHKSDYYLMNNYENNFDNNEWNNDEIVIKLNILLFISSPQIYIVINI